MTLLVVLARSWPRRLPACWSSDEHSARAKSNFVSGRSAPVLIWTARPDTTLDYLNGFCVAAHGPAVEELRENGWLDHVHPEDVDRCLATYMPAFEARRPFHLEYRLRHADGDYRWFLAIGCLRSTDRTAVTPAMSAATSTSPNGRTPKIGFARARRHWSRVHREILYLAGRLIEAQDVERARIARDLHDDVSQQLAGVSIAFSGLKQRLGEYHVSEELQQELVALQRQTLTLARNVRHLSHDLHPTVLQHLGLVKGLTSYCSELERAHGVAMPCAASGKFQAITPDAALCIYRIAQEALRNVIAHAGASRADVTLVQADDQAQITIADDGRGFDASEQRRAGHGLGLVSISERARIIGGTVSIVSGPNQGTRVQAKIPVNGRVKSHAGWNGRTDRVTRRPTVLLADDHAIVTDGLSRILREADFDVVGAVRDGQGLIDAATRLRPDVIITDLSMPGLTGLDVLARLKTEHLDSKVIVLTMHHDADVAADAIRGGASGFLLKESAGDELLNAVRHALSGHVYITPAVTKDVMERMAGSPKAKEPELTPRQRDILRLIVKGQRMKEIAANLGLSTRTVEGHKYEMMEALGVTSTAELVRYALDRRLDFD